MKIFHHQGELLTSTFPVENRLLGQVRGLGCVCGGGNGLLGGMDDG